MRKQLLTSEQEVELGRRIRDALAAGRIDGEAEAAMAEANMGLVYCIARQYARRVRVPSDDFVGLGQLGLVTAIRKFDPERGIRFSTYAQRWIKEGIITYIYESLGIVRIPRRYRFSGFVDHRFAGFAAAARNVGSFEVDPPVIDDPSTPIVDQERDEEVRFALTQLSPQSRRVVDLHCGGGETGKFTSIGREIGLTAQTTRVVFLEAVDQMRAILGA